MTDDRSLMQAHDEILDYLGEMVACGFDDPHELIRKCDGVDEVIRGVRERAQRIADEQADKEAREERETAIPPLAS